VAVEVGLILGDAAERAVLDELGEGHEVGVPGEKPFTPTTQEADDLIAIAKKNNKQLAVFQSMSRRFVRVGGGFLRTVAVEVGLILGDAAERAVLDELGV
jgi:hypothetical protein